MGNTSSALKEFLEKSPYRELGYRAVLWLILGWLISEKVVYSRSGDEFTEALNRYIAGIANWDKIAVFALSLAAIVYAFRSVEFSVIPENSRWGRSVKHIVGACAKVSGDVALAAYGAGFAIVITLLRAPSRVEGDLKGYILFSGAVGMMLFFVLTMGVCYLVGRLGSETVLYKWQSKFRWAGALFVPILVVCFFAYQKYVV